MSALSITPPFPTFAGKDGLPLEDGYIWLGAANLNPQTNPLVAYWDETLTQIAQQPIRTLGGYPAYSGTPARLFISAAVYSILVQDKNGNTVYTSPSNTGPSTFVNFSVNEEVQVATAGQTVFTLANTYSPGTNSLTVYVDGVNQYDGAQYSFVETSGDTVTFTSGLHVGALVKFSTAIQLSGGVADSSQITYVPAGAGAVPTNVQDKLRETVSVKDFGAVGDGVTDDTAAIQAALDYGVLNGQEVIFFGEDYKITSTLNITGSAILRGQGMFKTKISYTGSASAILCATWSGIISDLGVYVSNNTANGIEIGTSSRKCNLNNVYIDASAVVATHQGYGIYLNALTGFSGGLTISNTYVLQCFVGIAMQGVDTVNNTWTTVQGYNVWIIGRSTGVIPGSVGVFMSATTNGIGTAFYGGTIESYETGIVSENGSFGGVFEIDMEGNVSDYSYGSTFIGRVIPSTGNSYFSKTAQVSAFSGLAWTQNDLLIGGGPRYESYYPESHLIYDQTGTPQSTSWYFNNASVIQGGAYQAEANKFTVGLGRDGTNGIATLPSDHYIKVCDRSLHWGAQSPSARTGTQIVAWVQGSICYNSAATVGQPVGWMCTVSGTPGTWVALANL